MTQRFRSGVLVACLALAAAPALAASHKEGEKTGKEAGKAGPPMTAEQKAEMEAYVKAGTPGAEHKRLASTAGRYAIKMKSWHEPGGPPMESAGTATRRMTLDGRVLVEDVKSTMMGRPMVGQGMVGYDNTTGKHWSTWTDNMSTGLMTSEGTCAADRSCTYAGTFMDPVKKAPVRTRIVTSWKSPTTEVMEMHGPGRDGKEMKMMEITYTKQK